MQQNDGFEREETYRKTSDVEVLLMVHPYWQ